ncbi:hypothetical protein [Enterobacter hormaechei]|uniref:hypothetical protein n=1 Tax=Enterobacter hormaechei TaxID=158836 RepID=UPI0026EAB5C2|nr:hypothetical protein [Enterobacter hormaechei]
MGFTTALIGALISSAFYLVLYFFPESLTVNTTALGTVIAFVGLHVALKRILRNHTLHVFLLFAAASLVTLDRSSTDTVPVFLVTLLAAHLLLILFVGLTFEVAQTETEEVQAQQSDIQQEDIDGK